MTMHTSKLGSKPPTEIIQLVVGNYVKRAPTQEELARMPVLRVVTGYTCDRCGSTNVHETELLKARDGEWSITICGDCNGETTYKLN